MTISLVPNMTPTGGMVFYKHMNRFKHVMVDASLLNTLPFSFFLRISWKQFVFLSISMKVVKLLEAITHLLLPDDF